MRDLSPAISWIEPVLKSDLEPLEHLLFDVFDVSELGPTSKITAFRRTLDLYDKLFHQPQLVANIFQATWVSLFKSHRDAGKSEHLHY